MTTCNDLPPEIMEAILRRLPAKSLGRLKCVSKPWSSLISNPKFIKTHLHHNRHHKNLILISDNTTSLYSVDINELYPYHDINEISANGKQLSFRQYSIVWENILGSCNGVVLAKGEDGKFYLINPTTREVFEIPISPFALPIGKSFVLYGFGYDSSTDDYKVISISNWYTYLEHYPDCNDMFVSIYSLRSNSWRKLQDSPYHHRVWDASSGVLINENLHWLASKRPEYSPTLVRFSLANEEFNEIELPDSGESALNHLCALGEKLVVYGNNDLWVMEEYGVGESWTKVSVPDVVELGYLEPVCWLEGSNGDMVLWEDSAVVIYIHDDEQCMFAEIIDAPEWFAVRGTYIETLESFKRFLTL